MYKKEDFTYGVELEYGNCNRKQKLVDGASWNDKDNTCVSSTGIANDPTGKLYQYGGEINTRPTETIEEQIEHIQKVNACLSPVPIVNYRSNLHIHVRVPGLKDDLNGCKKLLQYIEKHQDEAFKIVEQIPGVNPDQHPEVVKWEKKREKRRYKSHQYKVPQARVEAMMAANTTQEFFEEHAVLTEKGRMWYFAPRAGINLRQMWEETETIEFRHFPGTLNMKEMHSCILWCQQFLHYALNDPKVSPQDFFKLHEYTFPSFEPYEFKTEQIYQWTNFDKNTKTVVRERLNKLRELIDIDDIKNITSEEIFPFVREHMGLAPMEEYVKENDIFDLF